MMCQCRFTNNKNTTLVEDVSKGTGAPLPPGSELLSATEFLNRGGKGEAVPPRSLSPADDTDKSEVTDA